jgi:hypothetical protein
MGDSLAGYLVDGGSEKWRRDAAWSGVAGSGLGSVVIAGKAKGRGYDALDPATGVPRWSDPDASGAWTFTNLVIGVACPQDSGCVLTARTPENGTVRWQARLTGDARPLAGANRPLVGLRAMGRRPSMAPRPVPPVLGFPLDDEVQVIGTGDGARLHRYRSEPSARFAAVGHRVVVVTATFRGDACTRHVAGRDPGTDQAVWHRDGYDLHTTSGLGCDQRTDPPGGGGLIAAVSGDGHEVLLDPDTGNEVYRAPPDAKLLDTDGRLVLVRTDKKSVAAVEVRTGRTVWTRPYARGMSVSLGPSVVVFADPDEQKLTVVSDGGTVLAAVSSDATVLGYADSGLIINRGRQLGLIPYGSQGR